MVGVHIGMIRFKLVGWAMAWRAGRGRGEVGTGLLQP